MILVFVIVVIFNHHYGVSGMAMSCTTGICKRPGGDSNFPAVLVEGCDRAGVSVVSLTLTRIQCLSRV
jgi:hypothetical protein